MTYTKVSDREPKQVFLDEKKPSMNLIVHGQGVFIFQNQDNTKSSCFQLYNKDNKNGLKVEFNVGSVKVTKIQPNEPYVDNTNNKGLINKKGSYYWFSVDSQNQKLQAGVGEPRIENVIYTYQFSNADKTLWETNKTFLESLISVNASDKNIKPMKLLKDPITRTVPLLVKSTDELTMNDIANNAYLPKSHLSPVAQQLFDCISGKSFVLNDSDFPDFSKAIEYSIATPGLWCYEKLKEKSTEFNKDDPNILETYLRITLSENNGESPGIPYVMEIWPVGHYSPIHNHGGSSAVVRVLNGKINVKLYPFLCYDDKDGVEPFKEVQVIKDEVTWISPTLNQIHQLHNLDSNKDTCITIQCYMYENDDSLHYDYFDYLDNKGKKQNYEPDSDMDFILFKETMKQEWASRNSVVKSTTIKKWTSIFSSCGKE
jgi:predicted metal-dependent enzyme (double-stranded beta helix superfamily)|uniref:Cysteine dioxygenase n=1 Tax=viral metagenome TaxID=1070528 RepID=A0A6C0CUI4_9ZZZZ